MVTCEVPLSLMPKIAPVGGVMFMHPPAAGIYIPVDTTAAPPFRFIHTFPASVVCVQSVKLLVYVAAAKIEVDAVVTVTVASGDA